MSFTSQLIHNLSHYHLPDKTTPLLSLLPESVECSGAETRYLLYPLAAGSVCMPQNASLSFQGFPAYCLLRVTEGCGILKVQNDSLGITGGDFLFFSCDIPFSLTAETALSYSIVYFNGNTASYFFDTLTDAFSLHLKNAAYLETDFTELLSVCKKQDMFSAHRLFTSLLCESVALQNTADNTLPAFLRQNKIKQFIEEAYDRSISLSSLEEQFSLNRYRLCREFQSCFAISPIHYLHNVRIRHAKSLLATTSERIQQISSQVGYENVNLFIRHFKGIAGCTPGIYRQRKGAGD